MTALSTAPNTFDLSSQRLQKAINEIDKSVDHLQKTKEALLATDRDLRFFNDRAQRVTIERLVRGNPTTAVKFRGLTKRGERLEVRNMVSTLHADSVVCCPVAVNAL